MGMNDDFGTIDSEDESIQCLEKEKKIIVDKIEEFKEKLANKKDNSDYAGLPVDDLSDAWMNEEFVAFKENEEESLIKSKPLLSTNINCYSPLCSELCDGKCYSPTCMKNIGDENISEYDETDKEAQMYTEKLELSGQTIEEGRLS